VLIWFLYIDANAVQKFNPSTFFFRITEKLLLLFVGMSKSDLRQFFIVNLPKKERYISKILYLCSAFANCKTTLHNR